MTDQPETRLSVQHTDALWDAVRIPGPRTPTFTEQHQRVCATVADILEEMTPAAVAPPTDRAALRDRIAEAAQDGPTWMIPRSLAEEIADAVLAALPAPVDRAAVLRDFLWRLEQSAGDAAAEKFLDDNPELRRLAAEATPEPATDECSASISGSCLRESQPETACDTEGGECVYGGRPAVVQPQPDDTQDRVVAYRMAVSNNLLCTLCCGHDNDRATSLTSDDLPDGGVCAGCGVDVLIRPETGEAEAKPCTNCKGSGLDPRANGEFDCPDCQPVQHAPGKAVLCPDCRAKGHAICMDDEAQVQCTASVLRKPHGPHGWEPQPGMAPVRCPGFCNCEHPADEHSVYGCADGCGCEYLPALRKTS